MFWFIVKEISLVTVEVFMQIRLIQEHKNKIIIYMVHDILMWFDQLCLHLPIKNNHSTV